MRVRLTLLGYQVEQPQRFENPDQAIVEPQLKPAGRFGMRALFAGPLPDFPSIFSLSVALVFSLLAPLAEPGDQL